jgi:hypothetical protein
MSSSCSRRIALGLLAGWAIASPAASGCSYGDDIPAPTVSAAIPEHVRPGESLTLLGSSFCQQPVTDDAEEADPLACANIGAVVFGTTPGNIDTYTDTMVTAETPPVAPGTVQVFITVAGRRSNRLALVIEAPGQN